MSVDLDDKLRTNTQKISDIRPNGNLSAKFRLMKPLRTYIPPDNLFGLGLPFAEVLRELQVMNAVVDVA